MANCTAGKLRFSKLGRRELEADFSGGAVSSDAGLLLLREVDRRLKLTERVAAVLDDPRDPDLITHPLLDLIRQRANSGACRSTIPADGGPRFRLMPVH